MVRCGVDEKYCCRTYWAISIAEEFDLRVVGPEERDLGVEEGAGEDGAAVAAAACRFGGIPEVLFGVLGVEEGREVDIDCLVD